MKQYIIYECENCGKQSKDREEIMICEAAHLGLTVKEFDDVIAELMDFEKLQEIEEN